MNTERNQLLTANIAAVCKQDAFASLQWVIVDKAGERKAYCYGHD